MPGGCQSSGRGRPVRRRADRCQCHPDSVPLQAQLQIASPSRAEADWPIAPRLWMVPRQSWLPEPAGHRITEQNLSRLRELTSEFDFSILCCAPVSWLTASIGQTCDGLVLVLTANKTRRLVAAQIKDQLSKAQVPLLGTVLAERRFPCRKACTGVCESYERIDHKPTTGQRKPKMAPRSMPA